MNWGDLRRRDERFSANLEAQRRRLLTPREIRWGRMLMASVPLTLVLGIVIGYPVLFSGPAGVLAYRWWVWTPDQRDLVLGRGRRRF